MNNKTLLGIFVVVFLLVGAIWFVRKSPELLKKFHLPSFAVKPTPTGVVPTIQPGKPVNTAIQPSGSTPSGLISCSAVIRAQSCNALPEKTVCGYDQTRYQDGHSEIHALPYNTACHYCSVFNANNELSLGNRTMTALGYTDGPCSK